MSPQASTQNTILTYAQGVLAHCFSVSMLLAATSALCLTTQTILMTPITTPLSCAILAAQITALSIVAWRKAPAVEVADYGYPLGGLAYLLIALLGMYLASV